MSGEIPLWVDFMLRNSSIYANFVTHLSCKMLRYQDEMEKYIKAGDMNRAQVALGRKDGICALFDELTAYEREMQSQATYAQNQKGGKG